MTDEERREAERLAQQWVYGTGCNNYESFIEGYAAACEAKRVEIARLNHTIQIRTEKRDAERTRSAKLIAVLKAAYLSSDRGRIFTEVSSAISEYEATHD